MNSKTNRRRHIRNAMWNTSIGVILSSAALPAFAAPPSRIEQVTLYPDSAAIMRVITVAPGAHTVDLTCLPTTFYPQSLSVSPGNGVRTGDIRIETRPREDADNCEMTALDTQVRALEDQRASLGAQIRANQLAVQYLDAVSKYAGSDAHSAPADLSTLEKSLDQFSTTAKAIYENQEQLKRRDAEIKHKLDLLTSNRKNPAATDVRTVRIAVDAPQGGQLHISYRTPSAGWRPTYVGELDSTRSTLTIERRATVAQATGEDWRGVPIRLSTGQPGSNREEPTPSEWHLDIVKPQPAANPAAKPMPYAAKIMEPDDDENRARRLFDVMTVETDSATEFELPGKVDLPSDAQQAAFSLATQTLPARIRVSSTPSKDRSAYLVATIDHPEGVWPGGNIQLRHNGAAVGTSFWNPAKQDHFDISFGKDDLVSISADAPKTFQQDNIGLIDKRNQRQYASAYTVVNRHRGPVNIEILEATPVSRSSDISVTANFKPEPAERNWERRDGVIAWRQTLNSGQSANFSADYVITFPKDTNVSGLR